MTVWYIGETSEWTHDEELATGAMESGMDVCEFNEDSLIALVERLEAYKAKQDELFREFFGIIRDRVIEGLDSHKDIKNSHFNLLYHELKEYERKRGTL